MAKLSKQELKQRSCKRIAEVLFGHFEEGTGAHSRLFEVLIPDAYVISGESVKGKSYREHIVPCCVIRQGCTEMYKSGASIDEVATAIEKHLVIVLITDAEAKRMDQELKLKDSMPEGWKFNEGSVYSRLEKAEIVYELYETETEMA